ncbi:MAG: lytic transglycosylase domain-containing protein [Pseudomonadales bacterium]|nr:lytic transglycosylase domain-containing protein [Pseudomonadales bacterium]
MSNNTAVDTLPDSAQAAIAFHESIDPELLDSLREAVNNTNEDFMERYDAEVWMLAMSSRLERYVKNPDERMQILTLVRKEALRADLQPELVLALIEVESHFDRFAVSRVGAQGVMQVMPFWKKELGREEDNLTVLTTNLRYGCTILKHYLDKEKGDIRRALARYNGSLGKDWYPERVFTAYRKNWKGGQI